MAKFSRRDAGIFFGYTILALGLLNFYFSKPCLRKWTDEWNEYFEGAIFFKHDFVPTVSILDFAGSVLCCYKYRTEAQGKKSWFEVLVAVTLMQFGGTTIGGLILGQTPSWIMSRAAFPALLVAWWLTFYCPGDAFWHQIYKNDVLLLVLGFLTALSCGHATGSWGIDSVVNNTYHNKDYSGAYLLKILIGTITTCGGGVLCEFLGFLKPNSFSWGSTPTLFGIDNYRVSASLNRCFWFAVLYVYLISDSNTFLPSPNIDLVTAHSVMAILQVVFFFMGLHNISFDPTQWLTDEVLDVLDVQPVIDFSVKKKSD